MITSEEKCNILELMLAVGRGHTSTLYRHYPDANSANASKYPVEMFIQESLPDDMTFTIEQISKRKSWELDRSGSEVPEVFDDDELSCLYMTFTRSD